MFCTKLIFGVYILRLRRRDYSTKEEDSRVLLCVYMLLLSYIYINRCAGEVPALAYLVFEETLVGFLHILRQVGEEHERGHARVGQLHAILDFDVLALV